MIERNVKNLSSQVYTRTSGLTANNKVNGMTTVRHQSCNVCFAITTRTCSLCSGVPYCSMEHEQLDFSRHKNYCISPPCVMMKNMSEGVDRSYVLVARRDLSQGKLIYTEYPLVCGPSDINNQNEGDIPSCLGCCRPGKGFKRCSSCQWSVCGTKCEKLKQHAENECIYFKSKNIKYPDKNKRKTLRMKFLYKAIMILRALLVRQRAPKSFEEFMKLPAQTNEQDAKLADTHDKFVLRLLQKTFDAGALLSTSTTTNSDDSEVKEISTIMDRFSLYGYRKSFDGDPSKLEGQVELVYRQAAAITRCCCPNVVSSIGPGPDFVLQLTAATAIKKNERLTLPWRHDLYLLGTLKRQEYILSVTGSRCSCRRCEDPTELRTYLSAVKCSKCQNEYLLPNNPTNSRASLLCMDSDCPGNFRPSKLYENVDELYNNSLQMITTLEHTESGTTKLEDKIKELRQDNFLHPHHYIIFGLVWHLVRRKVHYLHLLKCDELNLFVEHCEFLMGIEQSLNPLYSQERAELHFYIGRAFWRMFLRLHSSVPSDNDLMILQKIMELYTLARKFFHANRREKDLKLVSTDMYEVLSSIKKIEEK